jgi:fermentation-respiration switch protein FrsA (DUF1100 family)
MGKEWTTRRVLYLIWRIVRIPVVAYVVVAVLAYVFQDRLIYHPYRELEGTPGDWGMDFEDLRIKTDDGVTISAWFVPTGTKTKPRGVVLFCHGNGGNISHRMHAIQLLGDLGFSTLIFDYRGYGQSEGSPDEEGTYRDAEAAWRYLVERRKIDPPRIIIQGRSLGGAVAVNLAAKHPPGALILEATFTSLPDAAASLYPFLPVRWLCRYRYDSAELIAKVHCPLLVVHSKGDRTVPYKLGRQLLDRANQPKELLELSGDHNDAFSTTVYKRGLEKFLDQLAAKQPTSAAAPK